MLMMKINNVIILLFVEYKALSIYGLYMAILTIVPYRVLNEIINYTSSSLPREAPTATNKKSPLPLFSENEDTQVILQ